MPSVFTKVTLWVLAGTILIFGAFPASSLATSTAETRKTMGGIFEAVRVLLPLTVTEKGFGTPDKQVDIIRSLKLLSDNAELLADHSASGDPGYEHLAAALASYAKGAYRYNDLGNHGSAELAVMRTTDVCVACHSRLPDPADSELSRNFIGPELARLPLGQRAPLLVATRQFDEALDAYEQLLVDPAYPVEFVGEALIDYLTVCIRVKNDLTRPIHTLKAVSERADAWAGLRDGLQYWIDALRFARQNIGRPGGLDTAREMINLAQQDSEASTDRRDLVWYILASGILHQFLDSEAPEGGSEKVAEAYYLMGLAEVKIGPAFWISPANQYLEKSIRTAPGAPFSKQAYALLEEQTVLGYTGSSGSYLPDDIAQYLESLKNLIE